MILQVSKWLSEAIQDEHFSKKQNSVSPSTFVITCASYLSYFAFQRKEPSAFQLSCNLALSNEIVSSLSTQDVHMLMAFVPNTDASATDRAFLTPLAPNTCHSASLSFQNHVVAIQGNLLGYHLYNWLKEPIRFFSISTLRQILRPPRSSACICCSHLNLTVRGSIDSARRCCGY